LLLFWIWNVWLRTARYLVVLFRLSLFTVIEMCTILESSNIGTVFYFLSVFNTDVQVIMSKQAIRQRFTYLIYQVGLVILWKCWMKQTEPCRWLPKWVMQKLVGYTYEPIFKILSWYAKSDIEVWTSVVFTRTKQRIGFPLKDRQYLTALLDVAAKILRKC